MAQMQTSSNTSHDPFHPDSSANPPSDSDTGESGSESDTIDISKSTMGEVMDWAGSDKERAKQALSEESKRRVPRKPLIAALRRIA